MYGVSYRVDRDCLATFSMSASTNGWVGVGFSNDKLMVRSLIAHEEMELSLSIPSSFLCTTQTNSDVVIGFTSGGMSRVYDG